MCKTDGGKFTAIYTQGIVAEILDVGVEHYRKIENGIFGLQPEKMLVLYEKCNIDSTYLITGEKGSDFNLEMFLAKCSRMKGMPL